THWNLSADQIRDQRASTSVWHLNDIRCPGERLKQLAHEMLDRADTGVPVGELARIGFRVSDELLQVLRRDSRMDRDTKSIGSYACDRVHVFHRIIQGPALEQSLIEMRLSPTKQDRVAIGARTSDGSGAD